MLPLVIATVLGLSPSQDDKKLTINITLGQEQAAFTGRVLVVFGRNPPRPVLRSLNWFDPEPSFAFLVKDWKPGEVKALPADAISHPFELKAIPKGKYYVQAMLDRDQGGISVFDSSGNSFSKPQTVEIGKDQSTVIALVTDQTVATTKRKDSPGVKFVEFESKILSDFHKKPIRMRAGVALPASFEKELNKKFPVVYEIPGFGGDDSAITFRSMRKSWDLDGLEVIWVMLDANCRLGHHVFADSENNGPVGESLIKELIPFIEKEYRGQGTPASRLVTGHSSGGWSSLWLQTRYPEFFGGCWSTSPDPVDFRDFQRVNIYETDTNLFFDSRKSLRELSRGAPGRALTFQSFSRMEDVMGRGGQLASFEAVFSPRMPDGTPRKLWDRKTGEIDQVTAKSWEKYDIRMRLENDWATLGPKLKCKVNVWMGDKDTFYLDGAARLLKESHTKLKDGILVEMFPDKTHNLVDRKLDERMRKEMKAQLAKIP